MNKIILSDSSLRKGMRSYALIRLDDLCIQPIFTFNEYSKIQAKIMHIKLYGKQKNLHKSIINHLQHKTRIIYNSTFNLNINSNQSLCLQHKSLINYLQHKSVINNYVYNYLQNESLIIYNVLYVYINQ